MTLTETQFHGYAAYEKSGELKPYSYTPRPLAENDIEIAISHCGICGSDLHNLDSGWGHTVYPSIVGHEIVGTVVAKGSAVNDLELGQRVGVGCQVGSCLDCEECGSAYDQLCSKSTMTYGDVWKNANGDRTEYRTFGGYADRVRVQSAFAFPIPDSISSAHAAPLLCAGVTVFTPLKHHKVGPGVHVGVIGIGGLGHLALQIASKMGAHVTAISHSDSKRAEAAKLGATTFLNTHNEAELLSARKTFDIILCTSFAKGADWGGHLALLKNRGTLVMLGIPEEELKIRPQSFLRHVKLEGSFIGSREDIKDMLAFCAKNNIKPWIETMPLSECNAAVQKVREGKPRYRIVLEN